VIEVATKVIFFQQVYIKCWCNALIILFVNDSFE